MHPGFCDHSYWFNETFQDTVIAIFTDCVTFLSAYMKLIIFVIKAKISSVIMLSISVTSYFQMSSKDILF